MKAQISKIVVMVAVGLLFAGCAQESSTSNNNGLIVSPDGNISVVTPEAPITPPVGTGTGGTATAEGIEFKPVSNQEFNSYVAIRPLNNPSDFRLSVQLSNNGADQFYGTVKISYLDSGYRYTGTFTADNANNVSMYAMKDGGTHDAAFNRWFTLGGKKVFSGFFEDNYGAIVLIIDNVVNQNDGQGGTYVSGQVWYRNFAQSYAPKSPYRSCWFVYTGPYFCRSAAVTDKTSLYPTDYYRKLGSFSGLIRSQAFGQ